MFDHPGIMTVHALDFRRVRTFRGGDIQFFVMQFDVFRDEE